MFLNLTKSIARFTVVLVIFKIIVCIFTSFSQVQCCNYFK